MKKTKGGNAVWKPIPPNMKEYFQNIPKESKYLFYRVLTGEKHWKTGVYDKRNFRYVQIKNFYRAWRFCLAKARVEDFRLHDCRHHSATAMINAGTPERVVRAIANWKMDMLRVYYHIEPHAILKEVKFRE